MNQNQMSNSPNVKLGKCKKCGKGDIFEMPTFHNVESGSFYNVNKKFCGNAMCNFMERTTSRDYLRGNKLG